MQDFFKADNMPILLIFFGSIIAIVGAFLFNNKNLNSTKKLLEKAEISIVKSENAINHITGGDSWCYFDVRLLNVVDEKGKLIKQIASLFLQHDGSYPIPEIQIKIYNLVPNDGNPNSHNMITIFERKLTWVGQIWPTPLDPIDIDLAVKENIKRYQVIIGAPNGAIHQEIIYKRDDTGIWQNATRVERIVIDKSSPDEMNIRNKSGKPKMLYQFIADGFPDKKELNWKKK